MKARWLEQPGEIGPQQLAANDVYYARLQTDEASYDAPLSALKAERG